MSPRLMATSVWLFVYLLVVRIHCSSSFLPGTRLKKTAPPVPIQDQINCLYCRHRDHRQGNVVQTKKVLQSSSSDNEDDDGWGTDTGINSDPSNISKVAELNRLRDERLQRTGQSNSVSKPNNINAGADKEERDLFIPIFAMVSLIGLFGSYGYEMLRLYSRGELYLPWNQ